MIFIGIAVYPAVKKYCDPILTMNNSSSTTTFWIEDAEEITSTDPVFASMSDSTPAFLNRNINRNPSNEDPASSQGFNSLSTCDLQILSQVTILK